MLKTKMRKWCLLLLLLGCSMGVQAQYSMGNTGLLNIPTADMQEAGTFMGGGNYLPNGMTPFNFNTGNYFVNITFLSFLDRSMTARVRPLKEGKFHPSLLLGVDDPFKNTGINYFATVYGALTKGFSIAKGDRLALTAGYYFPLNDHSIKDGPFGGISYSPAFCREMTVMAEYDSEGFNVGAAARLWRHLSIHVFTREFNSISGGIRYECRLLH